MMLQSKVWTLDYLCCRIQSIGLGREINLVKKSNTLRNLVIKFRVIRLEDGFAVKLDLQTIFELRQLQKLRILSKEEREQERLHLHCLSEQDPDSHLILRLGKAKIVARMQDTIRKGSVRTTDFHLHFFAEQRIRSRNHLHLDELIDVLGFSLRQHTCCSSRDVQCQECCWTSDSYHKKEH